jgi:hypothetical protein
LSSVTQEISGKPLFCHPEFISGSRNPLIFRDAEIEDPESSSGPGSEA